MENGTQLPKPPDTGKKEPENAATALDTEAAEVTVTGSGIMPIDKGTMIEARDSLARKLLSMQVWRTPNRTR